MRILAINPGSTSTKYGVFDGSEMIYEKTVRHQAEELKDFARIIDQSEFRKATILEDLENEGYEPAEIDAFVGRGGLLKPMASGTYAVNDGMLSDLREARYGEHASNLGALIADELARAMDKPAFIVDPVVVDELWDMARISGHPEMPRISIFHALNQKAVAKRYAKSVNKPYEKMNLIIAHLGGGISVGFHKQGQVVDVNNALDGDGPFSPERTGTVPVGGLINMCFSGKYDKAQMKNQVKGGGGLVAYFGTNSVKELTDERWDDPQVRLVLGAMTYQIAKEIGAMAVAAGGKVDAILLTGGICHNQVLARDISDRVSFLAPVHVFPGEDELKALAEGTLRVLCGEEVAKVYEP